MRTLSVVLVVSFFIGRAMMSQLVSARESCDWDGLIDKLNAWIEVENKIDRFQKLLSDLRQAGPGRAGFVRGGVQQYQSLRPQRDDLFDVVRDDPCLGR